MVLENIPSDYIASLPSKKPKRVASYVTDKTTGAQIPELVLIPPLNANIDVSTLPRYDPRVHAAMVTGPATKPIPDKFQKAFNWVDHRRDDLPVSVTKLFTPVGNQHACGCCWAFAVSDAVSDVFVVNQKTDYNPKCSVTYALSCYPHCKDPGNLSSCYGQATNEIPYSYQCNGGAIAPLLLWISENGLGTVDCENFDWCARNQGCVNGTTDTTSLNNQIPKCECTSKPNKLYYIGTPISKGIEQEDPNPQQIQDHINLVKNWIFNYGTVVTGFFVYANLMSGKFTDAEKNPEGIYLEDVDYHSFQLFENQQNQFEGGHAVCVVGWGAGLVSNSLIADRSLRNPAGDKTLVPFWLTRNSWGPSWGQNGLFKMAMYPFNKIAQFDKYVMVNTPAGRGAAGGQVLFLPGQIKTVGTTLFSPITNLFQSQASPSGGRTTSGDGDSGMDKSMPKMVMFSLIVLFTIILVSLLIVHTYFYITMKSKRASRR